MGKMLLRVHVPKINSTKNISKILNPLRSSKKKENLRQTILKACAGNLVEFFMMLLTKRWM